MGTVLEIVREIRPEIPVETTFCVRCDQGLTYIKTGERRITIPENESLPTDKVLRILQNDPFPSPYRRGSITITSEVFSEAALKPCPKSPDGKHLAQISE